MAKITKVIRNYPVKKDRTVFMGLNWWQLISLVLSLLTAFGTYKLLWGKIHEDVVIGLCCIEVLLILCVSILKIHDMNMLQYFYIVLFKPIERYYFSDDNIYDGKKEKKKMKKSLFSKEKAVEIPVSAQDIIPFKRVLENGIIQVNDNTYALAFEFEDIDYKQMSLSQKEAVFKQYKDVLNNLSSSITYQEYITNTAVDFNDYEETLVPEITSSMSDNEVKLFTEFGEMQKKKIASAFKGSARKKKVIILSYTLVNNRDNINCLEENYKTIRDSFKAFECETKRLDSEDVLKLYYDLYNPFSSVDFIHPDNIYKSGKNIKSYVAPSIFEFKPRYVVCGDAYMTTLYMLTANVEGEMTDDYISDLLDNGYHITVTKLVRKIDKELALKALRNEYSTVVERKGKSERDNAKTGETGMSYSIKNNVEVIEAQLDTLGKAENQLFDVMLLVNVAAPTLDELNEITSLVIKKGTVAQARLAVAVCNQKKALNSLCPVATSFFGETSNCRNKLISDATTVLMPFSSRVFFSKNGINYGKDINNDNLVVLDRTDEINANGFVLGGSGGGKSVFSKIEDLSILGKFKNDVIWVIDPEGEYSKILSMVDGECVKLAPSSPTKINIFDVSQASLNEGSFDIATKIEFVCAIIETMKRSPLSSQELGILSSVVTKIYAPMMKSNDAKDAPEFKDFIESLSERQEQAAQDLALTAQFYVNAKDSMLLGRTTVSLDKKYTIIDISECTNVWRSVALQIILSMFNDKMVEMHRKGVRCWLKADEFHSFFIDESGRETPRSITFFQNSFKRGRKLKCVMQGITQNYSELMQSQQAMNMLNNSTFLVVFRQTGKDLEGVKEAYHLTEAQAYFLEHCKAGQGIIITNGRIIQFDNRIETNSLIYKLVETSGNSQT